MKDGQRKWEIVRCLPVMAVLCVVPLIVTVKEYDTGLSDYAWFPANDASVDLFLYWKGKALIILALAMAVLFFTRCANPEWRQEMIRKIKRPEMVFAGIYILLAALSACFSGYREYALEGGYEQWEGLYVLAAYVVVLLYTSVVCGTERMIKLLIYSLILGSFFVGLLGTLQFLQMDFFRTEAGRFVMNLLGSKKMRYTFNFSDGWVYASLYNPNYVGSYASLLLPLVIATAVSDEKKLPRFWNVLSIATTCLLTITLLGSQSLTGCVAIVVSALFFVILMWRRMLSSFGIKKMAVGAVVLGAFLALLCTVFPEEIRYGTDKLFHPTEDYHVTASLLDTDEGLQIVTTKDAVCYVQVTGNLAEPFYVTKEDKNPISLQKADRGGYYTLEDVRFDNFRLYPVNVTVEGQTLDAVRIFNPTINKQWIIARTEEGYRVYTAHGKLDTLREIPAKGFENNQHFGDKRGYIWSRTLPLLPDYMLLGSGPNTFTEVFPNDDYVGKTNMNYDGVVVTKPHNMYLQIWVQTGFLSMVAFLGLFFTYFISGIQLYRRGHLGATERLGVALMIGCFGYMVAGLANDSTVAVAPLYWGMLGLGIAVNGLVKRKNRRKEL